MEIFSELEGGENQIERRDESVLFCGSGISREQGFEVAGMNEGALTLNGVVGEICYFYSCDFYGWWDYGLFF